MSSEVQFGIHKNPLAFVEATPINQLRIATVSEDDFDQMIVVASGRRCVQDASVQSSPNADYELDGALLELKLVEEEGFDKDIRRNKVAAITMHMVGGTVQCPGNH